MGSKNKFSKIFVLSFWTLLPAVAEAEHYAYPGMYIPQYYLAFP